MIMLSNDMIFMSIQTGYTTCNILQSMQKSIQNHQI